MSATREAIQGLETTKVRTHLFSQGVQVGECFEGIRFVCELLEQCRVLDGVDEFVGNFCGLPFGCSRK